MTKDKALRLAEEAIIDELEAVTDEEFEDAAGKLDDALRAIWKALKEPTIRKTLTVEPTVSNSLKVQTQDALRLAAEFLDIVWHDVSLNDWQWEKLGKVQDAVNAALVDAVDMTEKYVDETVECGHEPVLITRLAVPQSNAAPVEPTMRRTTRDEKIVRPGVYEVPVKQEPVAEQLRKIHPLDIPFEVFLADLTTRPANIIRAEFSSFRHTDGTYDIEPPFTVRHLCMFSRSEMKHWPNFGKKCLNETEEMLRAIGLQLWENHDVRSLRLLRNHQDYYAAPVEPVKQEPVAYVSGYYNGRCIVKPIDEFTVFPVGKAFYTTPQPRQDVDLTDEEIVQIYEDNGRRYFCDLLGIGFARAVLAKHREKNSA